MNKKPLKKLLEKCWDFPQGNIWLILRKLNDTELKLPFTAGSLVHTGI